MNKQEVMKMQTWVLKVNIQCRCDGCEKKIRKLLQKIQKIDGVYSTSVNAEQGRVTVTGNVDPSKLIKKLEKSGKHAQLLGSSASKGPNNFQLPLNSQFKNMQLDHHGGKGGNGNGKAQKGGGKGQQQQQVPIHQFQQQLQQQILKGSNIKDLKNNKDQKSVRFNLQPQHHHDDYEDDLDGLYDDDYDLDDDDLDDYDDEFDDDFDEEDEEIFAHGHGHGGGGGGGGAYHHLPNKMMPMMMGGKGFGPHGPQGMINGLSFGNDKKGGGGGGGGNGKKGGGGGGMDFEIPVVMKGKGGGGGGNNDGNKNVNGGKKSGGDSNKNGSQNKGGNGNQKKDGKEKNRSKGGIGGVGAFLGFGRKSKKEESGNAIGKGSSTKNKSGGTNNGNGGSGNNHHGNGSNKKGGGKNDGAHDINIKMKQGAAYSDFDGYNNGGAKKMAQMMGPQMGHQHMGNMGPMGNFGRMPNMVNIPAVQGLPAQAPMSNGYYQGMGHGNPYNQQYMAMMMNQQRQMPNDMYQPMMYAPQHPAVNYMPPPMLQPPTADPLTHYFSDENANSCSIM